MHNESQLCQSVGSRQHLVLVGMMGVGKTTVGRYLAAQLDRPFVDLDTELVSSMGMSISEAFSSRGEPWFREQESVTLDAVLDNQDPHIVSPGGGVVLAERNRVILAEKAQTIWLRATPETILRRVGSAVNRPLLAENPEERVRRIDSERRELYALSSQEVIDVDELTTPQIVECIRAIFPDLC
jgi:shikimate kinase